MNYIVFETQTKADGTVNILAGVSRSTYALTLSYFYERCSKMTANTEFTSVSVMMVDQDLNVIKHETLQTSYVPAE